jgi:hypothetical protein
MLLTRFHLLFIFFDLILQINFIALFRFSLRMLFIVFLVKYFCIMFRTMRSSTPTSLYGVYIWILNYPIYNLTLFKLSLQNIFALFEFLEFRVENVFKLFIPLTLNSPYLLTFSVELLDYFKWHFDSWSLMETCISDKKFARIIVIHVRTKLLTTVVMPVDIGLKLNPF